MSAGGNEQMITDWLAMLGNYFPVVVIGCIELIGVGFEDLQKDLESVI